LVTIIYQNENKNNTEIIENDKANVSYEEAFETIFINWITTHNNQ